MVEKPVSFLEDNILQLEEDIFDEIDVAMTKVEIISLQTLARSNRTEVVFAVDSDGKNPRVSSTAQSLIRAPFESLFIRQSSLRLTASLFGDTFSFEVLKFTGGFTVSPPQSAFLMQKVQILFNFTLNFSIDQIQNNFYELTSQLKSGLHFAPYENLYISLTNLKGSTVAPPTTVQAQVLLAVGINPSKSRKSSPKKANKHSHPIPPVVPPVSPKYTAPAPQHQVESRAPASQLIPVSSPFPNVVFAHVQPPSKSEFDVEPPDITASVSSSPSPSSAGLFSSDMWALPLFLVLVLC
ncbi:unnamed protein product [Ilex paraguariensis]|uniref:DUF7036 domain-containing protein n=1 Tax=Ilex paraguariensis TaxID=185542 RepID=A0ABC8T9E1_9AQUA